MEKGSADSVSRRSRVAAHLHGVRGRGLGGGATAPRCYSGLGTVRSVVGVARGGRIWVSSRLFPPPPIGRASRGLRAGFRAMRCGSSTRDSAGASGSSKGPTSLESPPRSPNSPLRGSLTCGVGVGLACAYAGGVDREAIEALLTSARAYRAPLAQGAAFAAKARERAGIPASHTDLACRIIWGMPALEDALARQTSPWWISRRRACFPLTRFGDNAFRTSGSRSSNDMMTSVGRILRPHVPRLVALGIVVALYAMARQPELSYAGLRPARGAVPVCASHPAGTAREARPARSDRSIPAWSGSRPGSPRWRRGRCAQ